MEISPALLRVFLLRYRCTVELTPTERCCCMRLTYQDEGTRGLVIDLPGETATAVCETEVENIDSQAHHGPERYHPSIVPFQWHQSRNEYSR